jgi:glycosyltransferase involved in cell wall biosynthesis
LIKKFSQKNPSISIGLPVFNGEQYLESALESILCQNYDDFELIISDNASTDNTKKICLLYADKDTRIKYYRNKKNIGAAKNFNKVFYLSSGEYFKWAAYDDLISSDYLQKCISILKKDKSVVLCHSKTCRIDENGIIVGDYDASMNSVNIDSYRPCERFGEMIKVNNPCWWIFGLFRKQVLQQTSLMGNYVHADRNLLAEISLLGRIFTIPEYLFFRRDHPKAYTRVYIDNDYSNYQNQLSWWTNDYQKNYGNFKNFLEYIRSLLHLPLEVRIKILCYFEIWKWLVKEGYLFIGKDLKKILT